MPGFLYAEYKVAFRVYSRGVSEFAIDKYIRSVESVGISIGGSSLGGDKRIFALFYLVFLPNL